MNGGDDSNREWEEWVKLRESMDKTRDAAIESARSMEQLNSRWYEK